MDCLLEGKRAVEPQAVGVVGRQGGRIQKEARSEGRTGEGAGRQRRYRRCFSAGNLPISYRLPPSGGMLA